MTVQTPFAIDAPFETKSGSIIENKSADGDANAAFGELSRAFEAFKETNDAKVTRIDVVTEEKLARIDAAIDQARTRPDRLTLDGRRPPLGAGPAPRDGVAVEHKAAFDLYVRAGESGGLKRLELKRELLVNVGLATATVP